MKAIIYHNPKCGTSRAVLQILREAGEEPVVIEYLKTPLSYEQLLELSKKLSSAEALLRVKEPLATELALQNADSTKILKAIEAHPALFNRPVVVTAKGAGVCRPAELVRELF